MKRCSRCGDRYPSKDLIDWLDEHEILSPKFCADCYDFIVAKWEEGVQIEDLIDEN